MPTVGTVVEFDDHRGTGRVRTDDGRDLHFHCTQLAGGARTVAVDTPVVFTIVAGHHGRWEAADMVPVAAG